MTSWRFEIYNCWKKLFGFIYKYASVAVNEELSKPFLLTKSRQIFCELEVLPVPCIYILESICFIHQNLNSFKTNSDYHKYDTRTSCNIHLNYHRLTRSLNSLSHKGCTLYNKLPQHIKKYNNKLFKKEVKKILLTNLPLSVQDYLNLKLMNWTILCLCGYCPLSLCFRYPVLAAVVAKKKTIYLGDSAGYQPQEPKMLGDSAGYPPSRADECD